MASSDFFRLLSGASGTPTPTPPSLAPITTPTPPPLPTYAPPVATATPAPPRVGAPMTPLTPAGSDLPTILRGVMDNYDQPSTVDLPSLLTNIPLGSGFWDRLVNNQLTPDDQQTALPYVGGEITPELRAEILAALFKGKLAQYDQQSPTAQAMRAQGATATPTPMPFMGSGTPTGPMLPPASGSYSNTPTGAPAWVPGATGTPTPGMPGMPGGTGAPPFDYSGMGAVPGGPQTGLNTPITPFISTAQQTMLANGALAVVDPTKNNTIRAVYNQQKQQFEPVGNPSDPSFQAWRKENPDYFTPDQHLALDTWDDPVLGPAAQAATKAIDAQADLQLKALQIQVQAQQLDVAKATAQAQTILAQANAAKAQVDLERAKLDLAMAPLTKQETESRIAQTNLQISQSQQMFPIQLATAQQQLDAARQDAEIRKQQQLRTQAGDRYASEIYPQMIAALMPNSSSPPPIYSQLAQGAGVSPDDPMAQMAFAVLQNNLGRRVPMDQMAPPAAAPAPEAPAPEAAPPDQTEQPA